MLDLSKVWPEWTAEEKLGEGAYGSVYKCVRRERGITSYCAIKVITVPHDSSELNSLKLEGYTDETSREYFNDIVDSFANEIGVMESLKGFPNIVSVEDFKIVEHKDDVGWDIYIRMELLTSFKQYLESHSVTQEEVLRLGKDICTALEICEKNGIIHRDIKADNIFVDKSGKFKLGDFGVARQLERTRSTMSRKGTYAYMAPEVAINGKYDKRADIYSLGMVMYKLLNKNRDPFLDTEKQMIRYQERVEAVNRRLDGEDLPKPVNADDTTSEIILKACKFNKEDRYSSAKEMKAAIESLLADSKDELEVHEEVQTNIQKEITEEIKPEESKAEKSETNIIPVPSKPSKVNKKTIGIIVAVIAVVVIAGVFIFGTINRGTDKDSSDTVAQIEQETENSNINEKEIYRAYLDSEEGRDLYLYHADIAAEEGYSLKWIGAEDIHYKDIDNDNIDECFVCLEYLGDNYLSFFNITLLDIKENKVVNVHTFENVTSSRWCDRFSLTKTDDQYFISVKMAGGSGHASSATYTYDGSKMVLDNSTYTKYDPSLEDMVYYMSNSVNIHGNEDIIEESMKINESDFNENWDSLSENVELAYAVYEYDSGNLACKEDTQVAIYKKFQDSEYYSEDIMIQHSCRDYNNDGKYEMIICQFVEDEYDYTISGDLYLVTEDGITDIQKSVFVDEDTGIHSVRNFRYSNYCIDGRWFFAFEEIYATRAATRLFTVIDGEIQEVSINNGEIDGCLKSIRPYGATVSFSAYDNSVDGVGHTHKEYYFYWDEESLSFKEYGAIEITQEEFLKCEGAKELLHEINSKGYIIDNILYRGNNIININYIIDNTELDNINLKLEEDGSLDILHDGYTGLDGNNGFGGSYLSAVCPEIAEYPGEFPL